MSLWFATVPLMLVAVFLYRRVQKAEKEREVKRHREDLLKKLLKLQQKKERKIARNREKP
jgi:uncharacterized protein YlxW (UPF0749 family)